MTSQLTREYWVKVLKDWAEVRLPPPQFDECCAVLDELMQSSANQPRKVKCDGNHAMPVCADPQCWQRD